LPSILVTEAGTYSVTGFDFCGDPVTAEIDIDQEDLDFCGVNPSLTGEPCLEFPNAFVPESREEINRFFAPKNECGDLDNYELRIYNRWGAEVFQTNRVDDGWNGRKGDKDAPNDVYFFYASYGNGGVMFEEKGDLILIR
jgi:gliding motility-associated-like protein